jgi:hypothetical protein
MFQPLARQLAGVIYITLPTRARRLKIYPLIPLTPLLSPLPFTAGKPLAGKKKNEKKNRRRPPPPRRRIGMFKTLFKTS